MHIITFDLHSTCKIGINIPSLSNEPKRDQVVCQGPLDKSMADSDAFVL